MKTIQKAIKKGQEQNDKKSSGNHYTRRTEDKQQDESRKATNEAELLKAQLRESEGKLKKIESQTDVNVIDNNDEIASLKLKLKESERTIKRLEAKIKELMTQIQHPLSEEEKQAIKAEKKEASFNKEIDNLISDLNSISARIDSDINDKSMREFISRNLSKFESSLAVLKMKSPTNTMIEFYEGKLEEWKNKNQQKRGLFGR